MADLLDRLRTVSREFVQRVSGKYAVRNVTRARAERAGAFSDADRREMLLAGTLYLPNSLGGALTQVLESLGRTDEDQPAYAIVGHFNPVPQITGFYANSFGGRLGSALKIVGPTGDPVPDALDSMVGRIYRWSNFDTRATEMTQGGANQGTVGLRIIYRAEPTPRVFLDIDDRRYIKRVDLDARGNVVTAFLEYSQLDYDAQGTLKVTKVEETISKYGFSLKHDGVEQLDADEQANALGICPYVLIRHETVTGDAFGRHAYAGSEPIIHAINFALSQLDESTVQHVWPYIFATSPAAKPSKLSVGRATLIYSQTREGMPQPTFDPMVAKVDVAGVVAFAAQRVDWLRERQPQMLLNSLSLLSGVSGETLQQVLKPAEAESLRARTIYEDGVRRALQIAMSFGIFNRVPGFDLGTGVGTIEAVERAYGDGEGPEAFAFADRPALPPTATQLQQQAVADAAGDRAKLEIARMAQQIGLPEREVWRRAGMSEADIDARLREREEQPILPTEDDEPDPLTNG